jgi:magnesium transporter
MDTRTIEYWKHNASYDPTQAAAELANAPDDVWGQVLRELGSPFLVTLIAQVGSDLGAALVRRLADDDERENVILRLSAYKSSAIKEILSYPGDTAGAMMSKEVLAVRSDMTIRQAVDHLSSLDPERKGRISYIYVLDEDHMICGTLQTKDLIMCPQDTPVKKIAHWPVVQVEAMMTKTDVAQLLQRHRYFGLPVVNAEQKLVGIINANAIIDYLEKESLDDMAKMAGTGVAEITAKSVRAIIGARGPWLAVSMLSGLFCAVLTGMFEHAIPGLSVFLLFVPVVLGLSESTGVQSATIVVHNIAKGNTKLRKLMPIVTKESMAAVYIGIMCGIFAGVFAFLWKSSLAVGVGIALSMSLTILVSAAIGLVLPFAFKRFGVDPALASGPLVLAVCDVQTLFIYFSVAGRMLAAIS